MQVSDIKELAQSCQLNVVVGPPGCGKTTHLGSLVNRAAESGWQPLVMSLTRAAAREVAGRDLEIDPRRIGTLHAHAYAALGGPTIAETKLKEFNSAVEYGWRVPESYGKQPRLLDPNEATSDDGASGPDATQGGKFLEEAGVLRARMVPPERWANTLLRGWHEAWTNWKREAGYLDFTDLLEHCLEQGIRPSLDYDVLYADESQDLSRLESSLVLDWARDARAVVMCGDPRQNLFSWRGSDPAVFAELWANARQTRVLSQSYRVPRAVHARAVKWADQLRDGSTAEYLPRDADGALKYGLSLAPYHRAVLTSEIIDRAESGQTVMALTACSYQLHQLCADLRAAGQTFHNPYRTHNGRWNPLLYAHKPSSTAGSVLGFSRIDDGAWGAAARVWTAPELRGWVALTRAEVWTRGAKTEIASLGDDAPVTAEWVAERVASADVLPGVFSGDPRWLLAHATPGKAKGLEYPVAVAVKHGPWRLIETPKITVGTVHSVKGGEASAVYLFPDLSPAGYLEWHGGGRDAIVRMGYVGMTRAREELILGSAGSPRAVVW